jgi:hypothetical protein
MKLKGKTVIITSNSSVFLKLTKIFIVNSGHPRTDFIIIAENGLPPKQVILKRIKKIGLLSTIDEWMYTFYEALFNQWEKAEYNLLNDIDISSFIPDILTDSVNRSSYKIINQIKKYAPKNLISLGSGFIPSIILENFDVKINIHPGILPNYKGIGTPEAIMQGDLSLLGWSIHELTPEIDAGRIIYSHKIDYKTIEKMTFAEMYIAIYKSAALFSIPFINNDFEKGTNFNLYKKYNAFVRFTDFIKYKFKPVHDNNTLI